MPTKQLTFLGLFLCLFLAGCGGPAEDTGDIPETVAGKQEVLQARKAELRELEHRIKELETALAEQDPSFAPNRSLVVTEAVKKSSFTNFVSLQATVAADEEAAASAETSGRILRLNVKEGDLVRRGQTIATIDVEGAETQLAELETQIGLARTVYERQKGLWDQNIGSEIQFLQAKNSLERLQEARKSIQVQLNKRTVTAPISGAVDRVVSRAGELAMPGAPIVQILSTNDLKIVADVPDTYLSIVKKGDKVRVRIDALNEEFTAPVSLVGRTVDQANRTFKLEVDVPRDMVKRLKPNLLAEVEVKEFDRDSVIVIPQELVQREVSGRRFVFLAEEGAEGLKAKKIFVTVSENYNNQALIAEGLSPGDRLITTGARGLVDNQLISLDTNTNSTTGNQNATTNE
ncbi:MAG: efflux RND transporter periplasmic adaptor subunit [Saprospiraceae bacterium]